MASEPTRRTGICPLGCRSSARSRRRVLRADSPPLAKRNDIPYSSGIAFRLDQGTAPSGSTRYIPPASSGEPALHYRTLGGTGIKVSPFALGAMMFGRPPGNPDHDDSIRIIHKALDAGINFVDTADRYSGGESEEMV